jgi:3-hydroxyanthranilate 3,4-dioxygenase
VERFACADIERELKAIIERFNASEALRTCRQCGTVLPVPAGT